MKVCFCTNIWNHHQGPVCRELAKIYGDGFRMLIHQPLDHEYSLARIKMGWNLVPPSEDWIIGPPKSVTGLDYTHYETLALEADVLIMDSALPYVSHQMLERRHAVGKITFRMGERFFKSARPWHYWLHPRKWFSWVLMHKRFEAAHLHFLTMGHGCVEDLKFFRVCRGRTWRWGYLTAVSDTCVSKKNTGKVRIGWCGRMLYLKQVDLLIRAVGMLPLEVQQRCSVEIVGDGEAYESLVKLIGDLRLNDVVRIKGFMPYNEAMRFLAGLDVFVFPSNRIEGWGATLIEAMDRACVPVANKAAGATLDVIREGENGFTFDDGDVSRLGRHLAWLIEHDAERLNMGRRAWQSLQAWSPAEGAKRLSLVIQALSGTTTESCDFVGLCEKVW